MKVSIITIVYNNVNTIASCLESVQSQTYDDIEHIVIDGKSNDGTIDIIKKFEKRIDVFISEKDKGLYDALNKGIGEATGDIVGVLHSDDMFYSSHTIGDVVKRMKKTNADLLYGNGVYVERANTSNIKRVYSSKPFKKAYLKYGWIPLHTTIFVKSEIFNEYGFYDESYSIASDYDISLRWFLNTAIKKTFLDEFIVKMRLGGKSTTLGLQKKKSSQDIKIIKKHGLPGYFTLACKIGRKIPQYLKRG